MSSVLRLIAIVSALGAAPGAIVSPSHSAEIVTITHQGVARTAVLHQPAATVGRQAALVIALHGLGGSGENFRRFAGLDPVADREGFVAVYPDAISNAWSYGRPINQPMPTIGEQTVEDRK